MRIAWRDPVAGLAAEIRRLVLAFWGGNGIKPSNASDAVCDWRESVGSQTLQACQGSAERFDEQIIFVQ